MSEYNEKLKNFIIEGIKRHEHVRDVLAENKCDITVWADMHGRAEAYKEVLEFINGDSGEI